jgi:hypothetical protein
MNPWCEGVGHSHEVVAHIVKSLPSYLHDCSGCFRLAVAGWGLHPLESAAFHAHAKTGLMQCSKEPGSFDHLVDACEHASGQFEANC